MTLTTHIAIQGPTDVHEVFAFCRGLLNTPDEVPIRTTEREDGTRSLWHPPGVGLSALLDLEYGADGPLVHKHDKWCDAEVGPAKWNDEGQHPVTQEEVDEHLEDVASDPRENGWAALVVSFDTAYGYRADNGERCSALHARLVHALGVWLDEKKLAWQWRDEFRCEWHTGHDGLQEFGGEFVSGGAADWFANVAQPAIDRMAREGKS